MGKPQASFLNDYIKQTIRLSNHIVKFIVDNLVENFISLIRQKIKQEFIGQV
jgi:hypothetical protein